MAVLDFDAPVYVAGHRGMVGSAIVRALEQRGHRNILVRSSEELDLRDQASVYAFLDQQRPVQTTSQLPKLAGFGPIQPILPISCSTTWSCSPI